VNTSVSLDDYAVIIHTDIPILNFICRSDETVYDNSFPFPASIRLIKPEIVRFLLYQRVCTPSMWCYLVKAFSSSSTCLSWIYRHISGGKALPPRLSVSVGYVFCWKQMLSTRKHRCGCHGTCQEFPEIFKRPYYPHALHLSI